MSTFNNDPFVEGEALSPTNLNTKAGSLLETPINDLDESSIERHALDSQHLTPLSFSDKFPNGYEKTAPTAAVAAEEYNNSLPMSSLNTAYPYTYQTFDTTTGGSTISTYGKTGSSGAAHEFKGWRIPAYNYNIGGDAAEIDLSGNLTFSDELIKGVICRGSVEVYYGSFVNDAGPTPVDALVGLNSLAIGIGFRDGNSGTPHVIERSVRFYSVEACMEGNASTFCFLKQSDLPAGDSRCSSIFMVVATCRPGHLPAEGAGRGVAYSLIDKIEIKYYNLSVTPLQAGDL